MPGKRAWIAAGLFLLTFAVLLASTGVAMADRKPGAMEGRFGVPQSAPGDHAVYSLALIVQMPALHEGLQAVPGNTGPGGTGGQGGDGGEQGLLIDAGARMVVDRLPDRLLPDEAGNLVPMSSFATTWSTEGFEWGGWGFGAFAAMGSAQVEAESWKVVHAIGGDVRAVTWPQEQAAGDLPGRAIASDLGVAPRGLVTTFTSAAGPCGFHSDLQGDRVDLARKVDVSGQCPPATSLLGGHSQSRDGVKVLASGHDDIDGQRATVFADVTGADRLRLWFTPDNPYPVRMLTKVADLDGQIIVHVLFEMIRFDAGQGSQPEAPTATSLLAPRKTYGPDESGVAHPFPLSAAWQAAVDAGDLSDFLAAHPDAQADSARFVHWQDREVTEERWTFTATDGQAALEVDATRRTAPMGYGTVPRLPVANPLPHETTTIVESRPTSPADRTPPERMPALEPAVAPLAERWTAARNGPASLQSWGFGLCESCPASWVAAGNASSVDGELSYSFLGLAPDGAPLFLEESDGPYTVPGESDPDSYGAAAMPDADDWNDPRSYGLAFSGFGVWTFPEPDTTAKAGLAAALVGLLAYLASPLLKGLPGAGALGLFSRIGPDEVMEHPLRSQIVALVEAEPGLHFQELARRLDTGRGTLEHHLRKLVAADVLSAQPSQGFTCYFPKGKVDRRLMAAAPVLKSDGARLVLQAIANEPGRAAQDIAAATGLTPSTVNYHLKRLGAVGLVETVRSGRFTLLTPTAIGQQAIATWSGT